MVLTKHRAGDGCRWALDGRLLSEAFTLSLLLSVSADACARLLEFLATAQSAEGELLAPVDPGHEVWAAGVTYLRSRDARKAESAMADFYEKVYTAERPELFFKMVGRRVCGQNAAIRVRRDSHWNVPEPELTLVINAHGQIIGYCVGNDVSSRSIEGENPLYLPQAKIYNGSCALGPGISIVPPAAMGDLQIELEIIRSGECAFRGETCTSQMKRRLEELAAWLFKETDFAEGVFLMTGTGIVPPEAFSLSPGDQVNITIGELTLNNLVVA
jgi:2-dehydro-3-deoxy-D-arabinonate dehydratase